MALEKDYLANFVALPLVPNKPKKIRVSNKTALRDGPPFV